MPTHDATLADATGETLADTGHAVGAEASVGQCEPDGHTVGNATLAPQNIPAGHG